VKEAASMMDQVAGEAATYFFHSRARVRPQPAHILTLNRPGRQPGSPPDPAATATLGGLGQALHYARAFYSSESPFGLFRQFEGVTEEAQSTLLGSLGRRLDDSHAALAEGPDGDGLISREEMQLAIESANRGSAPGWDGLPYEFYRVFAAELTPVLVRVFNAAFQDALTASPLTELLTGVICLLEKPGQSKEEVAGYRPITLLNTDVKLVMWIHSGRLQLPLDYLIDIGQSAFLRARDISDNVRYHLHLAARLQELGIPGWLLLIDMSKAYDSVARGWLRSSMVAMGFRESGAARWCRLLLDGSACRVRINGAFSEAFPVSGGLFQGSSLSCQEWVIALQPLVSYLGSLQAQGRISHLLLPSAALAPAACAHADDTKLVALDPDRDGPAIKEAFAVARAAGTPSPSSQRTAASAATARRVSARCSRGTSHTACWACLFLSMQTPAPWWHTPTSFPRCGPASRCGGPSGSPSGAGPTCATRASPPSSSTSPTSPTPRAASRQCSWPSRASSARRAPPRRRLPSIASPSSGSGSSPFGRRAGVWALRS
jgi:hypothetical protein